MKKLSNAEQVGIINDELKRRVQKILGWSDLKYGNFQMEMGYRYLREELEADEQSVRAMAHNKLFWSWWKNHWAKRDEKFVIDFEGIWHEDLELAYQVRNNPKAVTFYPQRMILDSSYKQMVGNLIDNMNHGA